MSGIDATDAAPTLVPNTSGEARTTAALGLSLGVPPSPAELGQWLACAAVADDLGVDSLWVAEASGRDVVPYLTRLALQTRRVRIGTGVEKQPGGPHELVIPRGIEPEKPGEPQVGERVAVVRRAGPAHQRGVALQQALERLVIAQHRRDMDVIARRETWIGREQAALAVDAAGDRPFLEVDIAHAASAGRARVEMRATLAR